MKIVSVLFIFIIGLNQCNSNQNQKSNSELKTDNSKNKKFNKPIKGLSLVAERAVIESTQIEPILDMNANWVAHSPYAYLKIETGEVIFDTERQWEAETPIGSKIAIERLQKVGLKVMLKPQLWSGHNSYTGDFLPADEQAWTVWKKSYSNYILTFAKIAQESNVELFCFGTELREVVKNDANYWTNLIKKIKQIYTGKLVYAANWDDYKNVHFWKELDYIGIDAYFPLAETESPSSKEMIEGWQTSKNEMKAFYDSVKKPIVFTEIGYRNSNYNAKTPWTEDDKTINNSAQVEAFKALFQTYENEDWMHGIFIWKWFTSDVKSYTENHPGFTPQNKPAQETIQEYFKE